MSPPAFQRAERTAEAVRSGSFVPSPDAALGDGDGAARHPYQRHGNSVEKHLRLHGGASCIIFKYVSSVATNDEKQASKSQDSSGLTDYAT